MDTKFTPGHWRVHNDVGSGIGRTGAIYVCAEGEWPDAQLARINIMDGIDEREANARLIAAAPEMFEALALADELAQIGILHAEGDLMERVRHMRTAALAKARGETV